MHFILGIKTYIVVILLWHFYSLLAYISISLIDGNNWWNGMRGMGLCWEKVRKPAIAILDAPLMSATFISSVVFAYEISFTLIFSWELLLHRIGAVNILISYHFPNTFTALKLIGVIIFLRLVQRITYWALVDCSSNEILLFHDTLRRLESCHGWVCNLSVFLFTGCMGTKNWPVRWSIISLVIRNI